MQKQNKKTKQDLTNVLLKNIHIYLYSLLLIEIKWRYVTFFGDNIKGQNIVVVKHIDNNCCDPCVAVTLF